jgi:DNA repair protein RadC
VKLVKEKTERYDVQRKIRSPYDGFKYFKGIIDPDALAEEYMWVLTLDTKNNVTGIFEVSHAALTLL